MGDSASAGWRPCKCSFIFEGPNELVENDLLHATHYSCISDPTVKQYFKHFYNRDELSLVKGGNSHETANLQMPSRFDTGLFKNVTDFGQQRLDWPQRRQIKLQKLFPEIKLVLYLRLLFWGRVYIWYAPFCALQLNTKTEIQNSYPDRRYRVPHWLGR